MDVAAQRRAAYEHLAGRDPALGALVQRFGRLDPYRWSVLDDAAGGDPFRELALHVVSQQISTSAALRIFARVTAATAGLDPAGVLAAPPGALHAAGLSGAKVRALVDLAERVLDGRVDVARLAAASDADAQAELAWRPFRSYAAALLWAGGSAPSAG